jgi:hypothetical protein
MEGIYRIYVNSLYGAKKVKKGYLTSIAKYSMYRNKSVEVISGDNCYVVVGAMCAKSNGETKLVEPHTVAYFFANFKHLVPFLESYSKKVISKRIKTLHLTISKKDSKEFNVIVFDFSTGTMRKNGEDVEVLFNTIVM